MKHGKNKVPPHVFKQTTSSMRQKVILAEKEIIKNCKIPNYMGMSDEVRLGVLARAEAKLQKLLKE